MMISMNWDIYDDFKLKKLKNWKNLQDLYKNIGRRQGYHVWTGNAHSDHRILKGEGVRLKFFLV